jgi:hypothetical protein
VSVIQGELQIIARERDAYVAVSLNEEDVDG